MTRYPPARPRTRSGRARAARAAARRATRRRTRRRATQCDRVSQCSSSGTFTVPPATVRARWRGIRFAGHDRGKPRQQRANNPLTPGSGGGVEGLAVAVRFSIWPGRLRPWRVPVGLVMSRDWSPIPGGTLLISKAHVDTLSELSAEHQAEFGVIAAAIERAIMSLGQAARVHMYRWGDGCA